jgi:hypothetical protein
MLKSAKVTPFALAAEVKMTFLGNFGYGFSCK